MTQPWIITCDPCVVFRFQTEYQDAGSHILSFESLVYRCVSQPVPQLLTPCDQRLYLKKLREVLFPEWAVPLDFEDVTKELFSSLKDKRISALEFTKAVRSLSDRLLKLARLYEGYAQKEEGHDREDILELAIESLSRASLKTRFPSKVLILAYQLSNLQKIFLEALSKRVEVEQLSVTELQNVTHTPSVFSMKTPEQEVEAIGHHLEKMLQRGTPPSSLFVFCIGLSRYRREFEAVLGQANIPFSFWNSSEENPERVSLLEWHPNTMIFPTMKKAFLCGTSSLSLAPSFLSEEEKVYLNQVFQIPVFKTHSDRKEEIKRFLQLLGTRCQKLYLTYAHRPAIAFEEFFKESQNISASEWRPKNSLTLLSSFKKELSFEKGTDFLPRIYSIRSLAQYQKCPYGFLLKECLNLHPIKKEGPELTPQEEGEWVHDVLWRIFSKSLSLEEAMKESVSHLSDRFQKELLEPDRKRVARLLKAFLEEEKKWRAKSRFTPRYFELGFGTHDQKPLDLSWKGKNLLLRGKIDRVNVDEEAREFEVIDYKTGSTVPSTKEVMEGKSFQLTLYAMAVEQLFLPTYAPSRGFFYRIKECDVKKGFLCETKEGWQSLKEKTVSQVFSLVERMETLSFPATPQNCYASCDLKSRCEQV